MDDHVEQILKNREGGGAIMLAGWGFVAVLTFMAGFASWQYAPRPSPRLPVLAAGGTPETTASIGTGGAAASRVVGGGRVTTVMAAEPPATQRDLDAVLFELRELKRTLGRYDQANEAIARRVAGLEEQSAVLMASIARDREAAMAALKTEPHRPDAAKPDAMKPDAMKPEAPKPEMAKAEPPKPEPPRMEIAKAEPPKDDPAKLPPKPAPKAPDAQALPPVPPAAPPATLAMKAPEAEPRVAAAGAGEADMTKPPEAKAVDPIVTGAIGAGGIAAGAGGIGSGPAAPKPAGVPTMAITLKPPAAEKPADKAEEKLVGVDLGGFRSLAQLRKTWADIEARRGTVTRQLAPLYQLRETGDTLEVRLVAGPFPTPLDAAKFCAAIKGTSPGCASTGYAGQPGVRVAGAPPPSGILPGLPMPVPAASP
jgi:hypothetical protein